MRISDWSSDVCSSDLRQVPRAGDRLPLTTAHESVPMPDSPLLTTDHDAIRVITVNRPDKLNALNGATLAALHAASDAAADDDSVRAAVLTGPELARETGRE